jgi:hypothetical protein
MDRFGNPLWSILHKQRNKGRFIRPVSYIRPMADRPTKITFGEMRSGRGGVCHILIYCADYRCSHHIEMSADQWSDEVRLSDIEPLFVCQACGKRGADVRPLFGLPSMGTKA